MAISTVGIPLEILKAAGIKAPEKPKRVSTSQQLAEIVTEEARLQTIRDANLEAHVHGLTKLGLACPPAMTTEQIEKVEAKIGRKVSQAEKTFGMIGRDDVPNLSQPFRPVRNQSTQSLYDEEIAEAEAMVERERLGKMTDAQRTLHAIKQAKADAIKKQADAAAMEKHLAANAAEIEWLTKVRADAAFNPDWTNAELAKVDAALVQLQYGPDADLEVAAQLSADVRQVMFQHVQSEKEDVANKLRASGVLSEPEIEAALQKRYPTSTKDAGNDASKAGATDALEAKWFTACDTMEALHQAYETLKADKASDPAAVDTALKAWSGAVKASTAAHSEYKAASAPPAEGAAAT